MKPQKNDPTEARRQRTARVEALNAKIDRACGPRRPGFKTIGDQLDEGGGSPAAIVAFTVGRKTK